MAATADSSFWPAAAAFQSRRPSPPRSTSAAKRRSPQGETNGKNAGECLSRLDFSESSFIAQKTSVTHVMGEEIY